jgi:serine protease Do/serine protease DegQ
VARVTIESPRAGLASGRESVPELAGARIGNVQRGGKSEAVVVVEVDRGSPAWNHGLRPGDLILGVNRRRVTSVGEFVSQLRASPRPVALNVLRGDFELTLVLRGG